MKKEYFILILLVICLSFKVFSQTSNCQIHITPNDTIIYSNSSVQVQLNTNLQASYYHWSGTNISDTIVRNPIVTALPNTSNQYILQGLFVIDSELVTNGGFENGNNSFTTQYTYTTQAFVNATTGFRSGFYSIVSNANSINHFFSSCTNGGNFLIVDGASTANQIIYSTTINVQPNTTYILSCDELNISSSSPNNQQPKLRFLINNNQLGNAFHPNTTGCNWGSFYHIWNSGNNTTATISIIDSNTIVDGNDFALDNISFKKLCVAYDTIHITVLPPNSCQIHIIPNDTTIHSSSPVQVQLNTDVQADYYAWKPNNNITDTTLRNPIVTLNPNTSNQYIVQGMFIDSVNLVTNGDFEQGNTGFTSDLTYDNTYPLNPYGYYVIANSANQTSYFYSCPHNGNMMVIDGPISTSYSTIYQNTINVQPNSNYYFSFDATQINTTHSYGQYLARLQIYVNNVAIAEVDTVSNQHCDWHTYHRFINSNTNSSLTIKIVDLNTSTDGNDFAIDNVSMKKLCVAYDTININVSAPISCNIHIIPNDTTLYSSSPVQIQLNTDMQASYYHWSGNNISDSTIQNPVVTIVPNSNNQYIVQGMFIVDSNLVSNGGFENGNSDYTTDLIYSSNNTSSGGPGTYCITNSANPYWCPCTHTGNFIIADGAVDTSIVYQTTVNVEPNTFYAFSCDASNMNGDSTHFQPSWRSIFQFSINNNLIGSPFYTTSQCCDWHTFYQIVNSGNNNTLTISIKNLNLAADGNDYALDNVSLKKLCVAYDTINIINDHVIYRDTIHLGACKESFPISFRDSSYNDEGTYTYTITTQDYDSIYTLIISKYPSFNDTISATICSNEVYNINGFNENTTGFYTHNLTSINGCDSIINLSLTVNEVDSLVVFDTIYQGTVYSNYGFNVVDSGTYSHYYQLHSGCKTFVLLYLSVIERPHLDVWLPNCFTPSSNSNTTFGYYTDLENFILISFEIYNRWGEKIFYSTKKGEYWDGKYKGKDCDQSTFVWRLLYKTAFTGDCEYEKDGTLILIR